MQPAHVIARHRQAPERICLAQIVLARERQRPDLLERAEVATDQGAQPPPLDLLQPLARHRLQNRLEDQGSVCTITSETSAALRIRSSISLARACASASALSGSSPSVRKATRPSSSAGSGARAAAAGRLADDPSDHLDVAPRVAGARPCPAARSLSGSRCVCTDVDLGSGRLDRVLDLGGDLVRLLQRQHPGSFRWSETATPSSDLHRAHVVDLADLRDGCGGCLDPLAQARDVARLDVDDDVGLRQRALDRLLDRVGGGVPLADRPRARRR